MSRHHGPTFKFLTLCLLIWVSGSAGAGPANAPPFAIHIEFETPRPEPEIFAHWQNQIFEGPTVWAFGSAEELDDLLAQGAVPADLRDTLRGSIRTGLDSQEFVKSGYWLDESLRQLWSYLPVEPELWDRLPAEFIEAVYRYQFERWRVLPHTSLQLTVDHQPNPVRRDRAVAAAIYEHARTVADVPPLTRSVVFVDGHYRLVIERATWSRLNEQTRNEFLVNATRATPLRRGQRCTLDLNAGNVTAVARHFALSTGAAELEHKLRRRLDGAAEPIVTVDVADLMPPFIRTHLGRYTEVTGPNCFNASLNVNRGTDFALEYEDQFALLARLHNGYRAVRPHEDLVLGDLMLYQEMIASRDVPQYAHAATYIAPDLVFTKNGLNKFNPYILQSAEALTAAYFPQGKYFVSAYRPIQSDETPIGRAVFYARPNRFVPPDLDYLRLRYNPLASVDDRRASLNRLSAATLDEDQRDELVRLSADPNAADVRALVQSLLTVRARLDETEDDHGSVPCDQELSTSHVRD